MILISGHKGFVGQYITAKLDSRKMRWVGYDLADGKDIRNKYALYECFDMYQPDTVIHLAALAGLRRGEEYPEEYVTTNVVGTQNMLEMSKKFNIKKFINFSSSSVYGEGTPPAKEDDEKNPICVYGLSKLMAERLCEMSGLQYITIRPFTVYGLNGRPDQVFYKWVNQIKEGKEISFYGDGNTKRGYVHVQDLVDGVIKCLLYKGSGAYNLGGSEVITLRGLLKIFRKNVTRTVRVKVYNLPKGDAYANYADISKAKKDLCWKPKRKFEEGVREIINDNF